MIDDRRSAIRAGLRSLRETRLLVAYANESTFVTTTFEYVDSIARYSGCTVRYLHVTLGSECVVDLEQYDVVFHSYCARLIFDGYVSRSFLDQLKSFKGIKLIAVQDEYDDTNKLSAAIREIGYHVVFTCVPQDQIPRVYPPGMFPHTEFVSVLTGYVPEAPETIEPVSMPLAARPVVIGYRGRDIGPRYGRLGFDKLEIGRRMRAICIERGIPHDIEWSDAARIYGTAWYDFVGSCRTMLGAESGSNVFDFDGSIAARCRHLFAQRGKPPSYDEIRPYTDPIEAQFDIGQISARIFEAAALRTPMILYSGRYSGAIEPDEHYIELKKDFSNLDEVLAKVENVGELERMAERAHAHLIASGRFTYQGFVSLIDKTIIRKAAELKVPLCRMPCEPLPPEPRQDAMALASPQEIPTRRPRQVIYYYYKAKCRENDDLRRENSALKAEIERLGEDLSTRPNFLRVAHHYTSGLLQPRRRYIDRLMRRLRLSVSSRIEPIAAVLGHPSGISLAIKCVLRKDRQFLIDAARIIMAREMRPMNSDASAVMLAPELHENMIEIRVVSCLEAPISSDTDRTSDLLSYAKERRIERFLLRFEDDIRDRPLLIVGDRYELPRFSWWLQNEPKLVFGLICDRN